MLTFYNNVVNKDHDRLAMSTITATGKDKTIFRLATNVQGWSYGAKGATKDPWSDKQGEENLCSEGCFMKVGWRDSRSLYEG